MLCATIVMANAWSLLSTEARTLAKNIFAAGLDDPKPEVQNLAKMGLVSYLAMKPIEELTKIALQYTKNSDVFADREKKKRKAAGVSGGAGASGGVAEKPEKQYTTTLSMMSCLILATPYDMPSYTPALITSFVRHATTSSAMSDTVTKTMQLFKATHQDRWDTDFKAMFSTDQLEDIQGSGASHYYS
jgi:hypothetical protein